MILLLLLLFYDHYAQLPSNWQYFYGSLLAWSLVTTTSLPRHLHVGPRGRDACWDKVWLCGCVCFCCWVWSGVFSASFKTKKKSRKRNRKILRDNIQVNPHRGEDRSGKGRCQVSAIARSFATTSKGWRIQPISCLKRGGGFTLTTLVTSISWKNFLRMGNVSSGGALIAHAKRACTLRLQQEWRRTAWIFRTYTP